MKKGEKILVTGAAGFIGSYLAEYLAGDGYEVWGIDNFSTGRKKNIPANINFIKCELRDAKDTEKAVEKIKPNVIFHLAAWAHEGLSQFIPKLITENNLNAFINLVIPAINYGMEKIVITSSTSVYGNQKLPFDEVMLPKPVDVYGVSKAAVEKVTEILADVHGFDYTIIRPHNVYGPRQSLQDPYRNVISIMINRVMKQLPPIIYGDGKQTRAFTYIEDIVPFIAKTGFIAETKNQIINIGPLDDYSINHIAHLILAEMGSKLKPIYEKDRPREVKHAYCTNKKARDLLGYKTSTDIKSGIAKTVQWAKEIGPQKFRYLDKLELTGGKIPSTWTEKNI